MFSESELTRINNILSNKDYSNKPSTYDYRKNTAAEREKNKFRTLALLESLRNKQKKYTPLEVLNLRIKGNRIREGLDGIEGIYIIHNRDLNMYYIGQAKNIFTRVYKHFSGGKNGNKEVYEAYLYEFDITVSVISLGDTPFTDLDELEDNAIRAYDCIEPYGYNKVTPKIIDQDKFDMDEHKELSKLFIEKMKDDEEFYAYKKDNWLYYYITQFCRNNNIVDNDCFKRVLLRGIKKYRRENKKSKKNTI